MSNVKIVERDGKEPRVKIFSLDNKSVSVMPYSLWQEMKDLFDIDENTIDAYDYIAEYNEYYTDIIASTISPSFRESLC